MLKASSLEQVETAIVKRMRDDHAPETLISFFMRQVRKFIDGQGGFLTHKDIIPVDQLPDMEEAAPFASAGREALRQTVIIKLNGGLGTSMGLDTTKSLLPAKEGRSFLEVILDQLAYLRRSLGHPIPLMLMNSFYTDEETRHALASKQGFQTAQDPIPLMFMQHRVPRLRSDTFLPAEYPEDPALEWCPPGHGDLYLSLNTTGLLELLLNCGIEYAFVSNSDNLGATLDLSLLGYFAARRLPFLMEVTERTSADRKGGHLTRLRDGRLALREMAQCPAEELDDFMDVRRHRFFNTNNLWINLRAVAAQLRQSGGFFDLPLIVNEKPVNPTSPDSFRVLQLECAMGAAIQIFTGGSAINVPRSRFSPVKTTDDLLALWSDAYFLRSDGQVVLHPRCKGTPPFVQLDRKYYASYQDFVSRFPMGVPSLVECRSFIVKGNIRFGAGVICRGEVLCSNSSDDVLEVAPGSILTGAWPA